MNPIARAALIGAPVLLAACVFGGRREPAPAAALETDAVRYTVRLDEPQTQTARIIMEIGNVAGESIDVAIPVWRPGRYVLMEHATTISHVKAETADGAELPVHSIDKATWRVTTASGGPPTTVRFSYRVYANSLNDRTRHIDDTHAFLSPASVFMYVPDRRHEPHTVRIEAPGHWRTSTGLEPTPDGAFAAPNYDVLVDSPFEIGVHDLHTFDVDGVPHEIVVWHAGAAATPPAAYDAERMKRDFAAIVRAEAAIFGDMPYKRYVFQVHAGPGLGGGTEHLNSTIMQTSRATLEDSFDGDGAYKRFLGLVSHEMFHTWNVKQLRPADLLPYDYAHENYTRLLWVAEGTTSYYDDLVLARAGLMSADDYVGVVQSLIDGQMNLVGWDAQSVEASSFDAWVKFNKTWADSANTTVSFYSKGALVSLLLDMELRARTANKVSLDTVMREMYRKFPLSGTGFTSDDMLAMVNALSGSDFAPFFRDYIAGTARPDWNAALAVVGLTCSSEPIEEPYLGLTLVDRDGRTVVTGTLMDGPAYAAGLIADDEVIALDSRRLKAADLKDRINARKAGDRIVFTVMRRDELRTIDVTLAANPRRKWTVERVAEPTDAQRAAFESWTGCTWDD